MTPEQGSIANDPQATHAHRQAVTAPSHAITGLPAPTPRKRLRCRRGLLVPRRAAPPPQANNNVAVRYGEVACEQTAGTGCIEPVENDKKKRNP